MSLAAMNVYWSHVKSFTKSNWKYAAAFTFGSLISFVSSFLFTKKLSGLSTTDLIFRIIVNLNASKYRKALKYDSFSVQPKIRPSTEAMGVDALFRNGPKPPKDAPREVWIDPKSKYYWEKLRKQTNKNYDNYRLPPFMKPPSKKTISSNWNNTNFELNGYFYEYPGCDISNGIIMYIHGGGLFLGKHNEIDPVLCIIMQYTECPVLSIEYQLLPEADGIPNIVDQCIDSYKYILNTLNVPPKKTFIMGASAGGGAALLTLQKINDSNLPQPLGGILISPIADNTGITMYNTERKEGIIDCMISPVSTTLAGWMNPSKADRKKYNNDEEKICKLPNYSGLYGNFKGLCPIYLSASLNEVLIGDAKGVLKKCQEAGVDIEYKFDEVLPHVTVCFATLIPEARDSLIIMIEWMKKQMRKKHQIN